MRRLLTALAVRIWRALRGSLQWRILWIFHRKFIVGVCGVVLNENDEVLLLRHQYWEKDSWGLPSGYARKRESSEGCLAREVREETGLAIIPERLLGVRAGYSLRIEISHLARVDTAPMQLDPGEVIAAKFFALNGLPPTLIEAHRELVDEVARSLSVS